MRRYLPKKNKELAAALARKQMLLAQISDLKAQEKACRRYLDACKDGALEKLLANREFARLLSEEDVKLKGDAGLWQEEAYKKNERYPEALIFDTVRGEKVRSKSEALIANLLYMMGIPYRYEQQHIVGTARIYPDFTALNIRTGVEFVIEHFGLMSDPGYASNAGLKVKTYLSNGYIPYMNCLFFYEAQEHPLDMGHVKDSFEKYLL